MGNFVVTSKKDYDIKNHRDLILRTFRNINIIWTDNITTIEDAQKLINNLKDNTIIFVGNVNPLLVAGLTFWRGFADEFNCLNANGALEGCDTRIFVITKDNDEWKLVRVDNEIKEL